ncbi:LOW QUALITY PROTEIN: hypothetical protein TorRG33x02_137950 [Trema orientale]|uniref:Uncharacterized protein n=1 Tax=Trema orientale TaxID=63057 RepID=A0A2P5EY95_TREOI|nr:LOW QUALITY PROTEIN: hypothetical protein TorRG33x02_137950 [Trema orientale]
MYVIPTILFLPSLINLSRHKLIILRDHLIYMLGFKGNKNK